MAITFDEILSHLTAEQRELLTRLRAEHGEDTRAEAISTYQVQSVRATAEDAPAEQPNMCALAARYQQHPEEIERHIAASLETASDEPVLAEVEHLLYLEVESLAGALRLSYGRAYLDSREVIDGEDFDVRADTYHLVEQSGNELTVLWHAIETIAIDAGSVIEGPPLQLGFGDVAYRDYLAREAEHEMCQSPEDWAQTILNELAAVA